MAANHVSDLPPEYALLKMSYETSVTQSLKNIIYSHLPYDPRDSDDQQKVNALVQPLLAGMQGTAPFSFSPEIITLLSLETESVLSSKTVIDRIYAKNALCCLVPIIKASYNAFPTFADPLIIKRTEALVHSYTSLADIFAPGGSFRLGVHIVAIALIAIELIAFTFLYLGFVPPVFLLLYTAVGYAIKYTADFLVSYPTVQKICKIVLFSLFLPVVPFVFVEEQVREFLAFNNSFCDRSKDKEHTEANEDYKTNSLYSSGKEFWEELYNIYEAIVLGTPVNLLNFAEIFSRISAD